MRRAQRCAIGVGHGIGIDLLNLFDAHDNDITYFYASRLPGEPPGGVEDDHFHPVEPRAVRAELAWSF